MKRYIVTIEETLAKEFSINAKDKDNALEKVMDMYHNADIVLLPDDIISTNFNVNTENELSDLDI